jgi:hypothetical protein
MLSSQTVSEDKDRGDDCPHASKELVIPWDKSRNSQENSDYLVAQQTANGEQNAMADRLTGAPLLAHCCLTSLLRGWGHFTAPSRFRQCLNPAAIND